jgi:hypothetical protein
MRDKKIKRLRIWDWNPLKYEWRKSILEPMARSPIHYTVCGRLAFKYEAIEVEDTTVMAATDSKMSAEKNTEYETALTIEMERFNLTDAEMQTLGKAIKHNQPVRTYARAARYRMTVIKDKMGALSGKVIEFDPNEEWVEPNNALWLSLQPHINRLKLGGKYIGLDVEKTSAGMFGSADTSWAEAEREKTILLEEVEAEMKTRFGQSKDDKAAGIALLKQAFGTPSWTAIQGMTLDKVREGHNKIVLVQNGTPLAPEVQGKQMNEKQLRSLVDDIAKEQTFEGRIDELKERLENLEPIEPEGATSNIRWDDFYTMPAKDITPEMVIKVANKIGFPLTASDTGGVATLIKEGKYLKAALEKMQAWEREGAK